MRTIAMVSQKGGTGKSTLTIGLAVAAMSDGHRVAVIDADAQRTLMRWRRRRELREPVVETCHPRDLGKKIDFLARCGTTLALVDTAAGHNADAEYAIRAADLCLIPARPSAADIEATVPTFTAVRGYKKPFAFVLNQTPARGARADCAAAALSDTAVSLNDMGFLALPYVALRNDQQDALRRGLAVTEFAPSGRAAQEIDALWKWVARKLATLSPASRHTLPANREYEQRLLDSLSPEGAGSSPQGAGARAISSVRPAAAGSA